MSLELNNLTDDQRLARIAESEDIIKNSERIMELGKALEKLKQTDEFKLVFTEGYFNEYAMNIFKEMTNPKQFAVIPLQDCEDTLAGIKSLKTYIGFEGNQGKVELDAQMAKIRRDDARSVLNAIG